MTSDDNERDLPDDTASRSSRSTVVIGETVIGGGATLGPLMGSSAEAAPAQPGAAPSPASGTVTTRVRVNGKAHTLAIDPRTSLLDLVRERLGLSGRRVASCLTPAVQADGREVMTIEGLSPADGQLHPMQQAFIDHDALQCGYCTPGQIMAAVACVQEGHATSPEQIREYMSGNLCRCGAYVGIVAAIQDAATKMRKT
jgi:xanthine dehydrogenase YagT iron-sulfur-binding subunit